MEIILISKLDQKTEFFCGETFRVYSENSKSVDSQDYENYMLIDDHDSHMILANIGTEHSSAKAGYVLAHITKLEGVKRVVVSLLEVKKMIGEERVYWLKKK